MELLIKLVLVSTLYLGAAGDFDGRWPRRVSSSNGLCRYGARVDCCWGWTRQSWGQCQRGPDGCPPQMDCAATEPGLTVAGDGHDSPGASVSCLKLTVCRWPRRVSSSNGLCRYGARVDCCWGWTRRSWGQCQPLCQPGCKHGECVGPNKCKCYPGYTGKTCNQDLNECGLKPRPCKHRCMNTYGSYKCYCLNGYMLMPDGTCGNARSCSMANCQYGCDVVKGEIRCHCPLPGLQLGPDSRTCVAIPKVIIDPPVPGKKENMRNMKNTTNGNGCQNKIPDPDCDRKITTTHLPVTTKRTVITTKIKTTTTKSIRSTAPPRRTTPAPIATRKPVVVTTTKMPIVTTAPERDTTVDNRIRIEVSPKPRGDVHILRNPGENNIVIGSIELGETADGEEVQDESDVILHSCSFDHGLCGWLRDRESDLHWEASLDAAGGKYLTIPEVFGKRGGRAALLALPLGQSMDSGELCLSFRHKLSGQHSGSMQVYVKRNGAHGPAVWGRTGGHGWRHTQITLWGAGLQSVILKGERLSERLGEIGLDDVSLRRGSCSGEHTLRRH
ncbi:UNVERIFIED_CONTAM: hypothetical protein FKN15_033972 [Acipenser sinensis]